ncbi:hypothetical protein A2U01_0059298, partial [Trifolium medium]|nr:hypothetical protein [Trifolium medium]
SMKQENGLYLLLVHGAIVIEALASDGGARRADLLRKARSGCI